MTIHVLLADDHAVVRDGLHFLLEAQADMKVVGAAANGVEVIELVKQLHPQVVVMDIAMPELNGILAAQEVKHIDPQIKIIMLSMHSTSEHITRALQAGAHGYLLKESAGSEVVAAVRAVQANQRYLSQKILEKILSNLSQSLMNESGSPLDRLSLREGQVLNLVVEGKSSAEIGKILSLSTKTVDTYRSRLMHKLGVTNIPALVKFAIQQKLIELE